MKKIILLIIFLFSFSKVALACDFTRFNVGKDINSFEKEKTIFRSYEPIEGVIAITLPISFICQDKNLDQASVSLFFIENKVVRIVFQNSYKKNRALFKLANSVYKSGFKQNKKLIENNQPENYIAEKNNIYYLYGTLIGINENEGNLLELFEIVDKKYEDAESKESYKLEEQ